MRMLIGMLAILAASAAFGAALEAQAPALGMLARLQKGGWTLNYRDPAERDARICLAGGREWVQLRHARERCSQVVVDDSPEEVTIQYSCPGNGYGRTHIRRETDRLVQIDTQGIEGGLPFSFGGEARWAGACGR